MYFLVRDGLQLWAFWLWGEKGGFDGEIFMFSSDGKTVFEGDRLRLC